MLKIAPLNLDYLSCAFDPIYFMQQIYGITPEPWQEMFLKDQDSSRILIVSNRQGGKSTFSAGAVLYNSIFYPNRLSIIIAPGHRQSKETFRKIRYGYEKARKFCGCVTSNTSELELLNGSRIIALPGDKAGERLRGYSAAHLIIIEEASRVPDEAYKAIKPVIAASVKGSGKILAISTPFGQRGFFYKRFIENNDWTKYFVTAKREYLDTSNKVIDYNPLLDKNKIFESERLTKEYIEEEIRENGIKWVRQEYYCEFTSSESQVFSHELILKAFSNKVKAWDLPLPRVA